MLTTPIERSRSQLSKISSHVCRVGSFHATLAPSREPRRAVKHATSAPLVAGAAFIISRAKRATLTRRAMVAVRFT
jgi:hypothetical protein